MPQMFTNSSCSFDSRSVVMMLYTVNINGDHYSTIQVFLTACSSLRLIRTQNANTMLCWSGGISMCPFCIRYSAQIKLCLAIRQVMPDVAKRKKAMRSSMAAKFKEEAARRAEARRAARRSEHWSAALNTGGALYSIIYLLRHLLQASISNSNY